jgi:hypothetical protein
VEEYVMTKRFSFSGVWAIALPLGFVYLLLAIFQPRVCYDEGLIIPPREVVERLAAEMGDMNEGWWWDFVSRRRRTDYLPACPG